MHIGTRHLVVVSLGLCAALAACSQKSESSAAAGGQPTTAAPGAPAAAALTGAAAEARTIFEQRCAMCHGVSGKGDGIAAANLNPKPRNYTDVAWQGTVTEEYLAKVIVEGGAAVGKSMLMPGNPDLQAKADVVGEIVKIIRGFAGK